MKLVPFDFSDPRKGAVVRVRCLHCGKWIDKGLADLEGPACQAYYCTEEETKPTKAK